MSLVRVPTVGWILNVPMCEHKGRRVSTGSVKPTGIKLDRQYLRRSPNTVSSLRLPQVQRSRKPAISLSVLMYVGGLLGRANIRHWLSPRVCLFRLVRIHYSYVLLLVGKPTATGGTVRHWLSPQLCYSLVLPIFQ